MRRRLDNFGDDALTRMSNIANQMIIMFGAYAPQVIGNLIFDRLGVWCWRVRCCCDLVVTDSRLTGHHIDDFADFHLIVLYISFLILPKNQILLYSVT